jgi:hypothetical protein
MSKALKWILGILIGLIVVAALVTIGFLVADRIGWGHGMMDVRTVQPWRDGRIMPWRDMPMRPYSRLYQQRVGGFFPLATIAGGLFCLGVLVLIVLGIIALVRALRRPAQVSAAPVAPPPPEPAPATTPAQVVTHPCSTCGRQVQDDWVHCPYCGADLSGSTT